MLLHSILLHLSLRLQTSCEVRNQSLVTVTNVLLRNTLWHLSLRLQTSCEVRNRSSVTVKKMCCCTVPSDFAVLLADFMWIKKTIRWTTLHVDVQFERERALPSKCTRTLELSVLNGKLFFFYELWFLKINLIKYSTPPFTLVGFFFHTTPTPQKNNQPTNPHTKHSQKPHQTNPQRNRTNPTLQNTLDFGTLTLTRLVCSELKSKLIYSYSVIFANLVGYHIIYI